MKINYQPKNSKTTFNNVKRGNCFKYDNRVFIKCEMHSSNDFNAVDLANGAILIFASEASVEVFENAEVTLQPSH